MRTFCPHLGSCFCVVSSFTTFWPNFTSGLLQVILPRPRIGMLSLLTVSLVIAAFHSCCLSHHVLWLWSIAPLWKAVITGNTVIKISIPIRGRGKITWRKPEVNFGRNVVKKETAQKKKKPKKTRWGQKVRNQ